MRITIVGLGLIGGSIGLALKRARVPGLEIIGYQRRPESAIEALRRGAVDRNEADLKKAVSGSDVVVLSVPIMSMEECLARVAPHLSRGSLVTDTASTKALVMDWARQAMPDGVSFIGGHPMAGKESGGIGAASADLFEGCAYCLTPAPGTPAEAVRTVTWMVETVGARPVPIEALKHDHLVAGISHLPLLLSACLVNIAAGSPDWPELARLASSGFRDTTRLASGDSAINRDIFLSNRLAVVEWLDRFIREMEGCRQLLTSDALGIEPVLQRARQAREKWILEREAGRGTRPQQNDQAR